MDHNRGNSCTGNSRNINIRYCFVKDFVDKKKLKINYCPTYVMLSYLFTKPLQGQISKMLKDMIMGYTPIMDFASNMYYPIKEHVVNSEQNEVIGDSILMAEKQRSS